MEEYSFNWILKTVSNRQVLLPFLPTYITSDPKNIIFLSNKDNKLSISHTNFKSIKDLLLKLLSENQFKLKFYSNEMIICYAITKTERLRLKESDLKEASEALSKAACLYIQPARPRAHDYEIYYILRLEYTRAHYVSNFYKQVNYEKSKFYDSRIFDSTCDIANVLMSIVENQTKKRVMIIEIEFLEDIDKNLWVSFIRDLKVAEPILCMHYLIKTTNDLKTIPIKSSTVTKFNKLAKGQHVIEKKNHSKPPIDYTFCKGRIRNKKSDLAHDISIKIPEGPVVDEQIPLITHQMMLRSLSIRKSGIIKASTPQARTSPQLEVMRARALHDELMKSPELKTRFRLNGLVGIAGIELQKGHKRSLSDSDTYIELAAPARSSKIQTSHKRLRSSSKNPPSSKSPSSQCSPRASRPKNRLILHYFSPKNRSSTPKTSYFPFPNLKNHDLA